MPFSEADKVKHPILRMVEPVYDSVATDAQKALAAIQIDRAWERVSRDQALGECDSNRIEEISRQLGGQLMDDNGIAPFVVNQVKTAFLRFLDTSQSIAKQ